MTGPKLFQNNPQLCLLSHAVTNSSAKRVSAEWHSSDESVVEVQSGSMIGCNILGVAPGSAVITGIMTFEVQTFAGVRTMQDTVCFTVTVEGWTPADTVPDVPPAEAESPEAEAPEPESPAEPKFPEPEPSEPELPESPEPENPEPPEWEAPEDKNSAPPVLEPPAGSAETESI